MCFSYEVATLSIRQSVLFKRKTTSEYLFELQPEAKPISFGRVFRIDDNCLGTYENVNFLGQA